MLFAFWITLILISFPFTGSFSFAEDTEAGRIKRSESTLEAPFRKEYLLLPDNCVFLDRNGEMLRFLPDEKGLRHLWIAGRDIPARVKNAFIAAEDKGFYSHSGLDLFAILRALKDNLLEGRIVSGGSTITQQLVRLLHPRERTYKAKIKEITKSYELERSLSKEEILEQYLNRVPMGNNIMGIGLASRSYFGKEVSELSVAEAAVLASLPKAPEMLNPFGGNREKLLARKNWVLKRMAAQDYLTKEELRKAMDEEIVFRERTFSPHEAPHFVELLIARGKDLPGIHRTTLDLALQRKVEKILLSHQPRLALRGARQAAVLVLHNPTMEVLAYAGSLSYSSRNKGYNNGVIAFRSAGSTFKPFLYALALEQGFTVSSLLEDTLRKYWTPNGNYSPENYDRREYGPVTVRVALGNSLNISAIKMMEALDKEMAYPLLKRVNLVSNPKKKTEDYGLGLAIGNPEVSLERLATAYAIFANGGVYSPLRYIVDEEREASERVFSKEAAFIVTDILSDPSARMITFGNTHPMNFPFKVSLKTGTSTRYRDGWIVGYTPEYTVGVWVGNFEGSQTSRVSGAAGAAPIFKDIMSLLHDDAPPSVYAQPETVVAAEICGISGMKPGPSCRYVTRELYIRGTEPLETCTFHRREIFYHELPSTYAGWLHGKAQRGLEGGYRLRGFSRNLGEVFEDDPTLRSSPEALPGIRVKNQGRAERESGEIISAMSDPKVRYSIGNKVDDDGPRSTSLDGTLSISYPLSKDRFVLGRGDASQLIRFEAISHKPLEYVDWFVDGTHYVRARPPYHAYWNLEKGKHNISAVAPDKRGDSIDIVVE